MSAKIRKGDTVIVTTGKDKNRQAKVLAVYPKRQKLLLEGVNLIKKHVKPNPNKGVEGGIVEQTRPIHLSNVRIVNAEGKADRVYFAQLEDGRKVRRLRSNGETLSDEA